MAADEKKKGGGLLVALMGSSRPKPKPDATESDMTLDNEPDADDEELDDHKMAFESFADAAGIPDDRRAAAEAALKQFVYACTRGSDEKEY